MNKIHIYYGPKKNFKTLISKKCNIKTLSELAKYSDSSSREFTVRMDKDYEEYQKPKEKLYVECLVCYSEEYSAITESAIHSFLSFLYQFELNEVYLQNPPIFIESQLKNANLNVELFKHEYSKTSKTMLAEINRDFLNIIIGQDDVRDRLLSALYPLCSSEYNKPAVIMFYGPSGVGKTETAKYISQILGEELFRKQLSMFHNEQFSSYLFGGKHNQNSLARDLLERLSNVILFDEFDKPHPIFHSAFYQMFDEGVFEDKNYKVLMKNSIVICTSNYKSESEIKSHLGEPIYSRFDAVIKFKELNEDAIRKIIHIEYKNILQKLNEEELAVIEHSEIFEKVLKVVLKYKNVREARRILKEAVSYILVQKFIVNS